MMKRGREGESRISFCVLIYGLGFILFSQTIHTEQTVGNAVLDDGSVEWSRPSKITEP